MAFYANDVHPIPPDHGGADCDDQLPLISRVGRGIAGDDARVRIAEPDTCCETHLEGGYIDNKDGTWHSEWISENINGGELEYQYNLRPYTVPRTFTITFVYRRPGRCEWSWTTPAVPYIWTIDQDGNNPGDDPDHIVGSGVATIFIRAGLDKPWREYLEYPDGTTREDFNAPGQGEAWTSNITFGVGGDIEIPNLDDIAKIIGISIEDIKKIIEGDKITINGIDASNLIEYIDKCDERDLDHVHMDLGFNSRDHGENAFGGYPTVKAYIDAKVDEMGRKNDNLKSALQRLLNKIYGGGTVNDDGTITWNSPLSGSAKIAVGNINVYSGGDSSTSPAIRTRADGSDNDLKGM